MCSNELEYPNIYIIYTLCDLKSSLFNSTIFYTESAFKIVLFSFEIERIVQSVFLRLVGD